MVRVVLIDDDHGFRSALAENLRDDGHGVFEYTAPGELPPLATLSGVGLLITDYEFPRSSGLALADTFHLVHPTVPIVLMTAFPTRYLMAQSAARDFMHLLAKPFDYARLREILQNL